MSINASVFKIAENTTEMYMYSKLCIPFNLLIPHAAVMLMRLWDTNIYFLFQLKILMLHKVFPDSCNALRSLGRPLYTLIKAMFNVETEKFLLLTSLNIQFNEGLTVHWTRPYSVLVTDALLHRSKHKIIIRPLTYGQQYTGLQALEHYQDQATFPGRKETHL